MSERDAEDIACDLDTLAPRLAKTLGAYEDAGACMEASEMLRELESRLSALEAENAELKEAREFALEWCKSESLATGHGDTLTDILREIREQLEELREDRARLDWVESERPHILSGVDSFWNVMTSQEAFDSETARDAIDAARSASAGGEKNS